ncbi:MAG TPA: hypothetical protein VED59_01950 [Acidimicrobiales bacterium]|nr:hypothetical protein [Acidimicrobiales bacterium]
MVFEPNPHQTGHFPRPEETSMMNPWILQDMANARQEELRREAARLRPALGRRRKATIFRGLVRGPARAWRWLASGAMAPLRRAIRPASPSSAVMIDLVGLADEQARSPAGGRDVLAGRGRGQAGSAQVPL